MSEVVHEKIRAAVCCAILELSRSTDLSLDSVRRRVFPDDDILGSSTETTLRAVYTSQLRVAVLAHCKEIMARDLTAANYAPGQDRFAFLASVPEAQRLLHALSTDPNEENRLHRELDVFQQKISRGLQSPDADRPFREALTDWLISGEPACEMWQAMRRWRDEGGGLDAFKKLFPPIALNDASAKLQRLIEAVNELGDAVEFVDRQKILLVLDQCCSATFTLQDRNLRVEAATVAISLVKEEIRARLSLSLDQSEVPHTVSIYAADCCSCDCSLDQSEWRGINLCIVTRRLYVHEEVVIDLSGGPFKESVIEPGGDAVPQKAHSSDSPRRPGNDGKCGRAGNSSGNLLILTEEFEGRDRLCVRLNGARGEDGEHGGDGCKGADGAGVTRDEIMATQYPTDRTSPNERERKVLVYDGDFWSSTKHYKFIDNKGREVYYSSLCSKSGDRSLAFIKGAVGTSGSVGGIGGAGGAGGYEGISHISDHMGSRVWHIRSVEKKKGDNGKNGDHGKCGPFGSDGNDMYCSYMSGYCESISKEGVKLTLTETPRLLATAFTHVIPMIPHLYSSLAIKKMAAVFVENAIAAGATVDPPAMRYPERTEARARETLQASKAMNDFAQVDGLSSAGSLAPRSDTARTVFGTDSKRATVRTAEERVFVVRERLPGVEFDESEDDEENAARAKVKAQHRKPWACGLTRNNDAVCHPRAIDTFDQDFRCAQVEMLELNDELCKEVDAIINIQPSDAECLQNILTILGKDALPEGLIEFARIAFKNEGSSFIRFLNGLISADGDHPCVAKWRAIVDVICSLAVGSCHCNYRFIALLMKNTDDIINSLLHLRIVISTRTIKLLESPKLWEAVQAVKSISAKVSLLLKLEEAERSNITLTEDRVLDLLVLVRHAEKKLHQLSQMPLSKWIELAESQSRTLNNQDNIGRSAYYLGVLNDAGFTDQGQDLSGVLEMWKHGEHLFGELVHCMVSKEIEVDDDLLGKLMRMGTRREKEADVRALLPSVERRTEDLPLLVRGLQDEDVGATERRRDWTAHIVAAICAEPPFSENAIYLAKFDDALKRTAHKRLRVVQKVAVISALESEKHLLQQVSTGEGKSYIIAAIAAIRCMIDKTATVDIITSSSALAKRDATLLHDLYDALDLTVAHNCDESRQAREIAYKARVVYGDMANFQRDYLVHTFYRKNIRGSRELNNVIVDEVDSMTLDSGNHVLYLSHRVPSLMLLDSLFAMIQRDVHSTINGEARTTEEIRLHVLREIFGRIKEEDIEKIMTSEDLKSDVVFRTLISENVIDHEGFILIKDDKKLSKVMKNLNTLGVSEPTSIINDILRIEIEREKEISIPFHLRDFVRLHASTFIDNCKLAQVMRPNVEYVVDSNRVSSTFKTEEVLTIVDVDTGVDLPSTQWAQGLHQFLQMKHACRITPMSLKAVFISNVTFLRKYKRLDGLSGTLGSKAESDILANIYNVDLIRVPTNKPRQMVEYVPSLKATSAEWIKAVYRAVNREVELARSALVICETIDQLQKLQQGLQAMKREKSKPMDDALDGIIIYKRQHDKLEYEERGLEPGKLILSTNLAGRGTDILLSKELETNGGLHVIIAFVPRNKRIEEQAMGRAARGDARGSAQIIALDSTANDRIAPALHDFKKQRDEVEKLRIEELHHHFEYRVAIEEDALEQFRIRTDDQLFRDSSSFERLPEADDVIYRALLDEWTLWLDSMDATIKACAAEEDTEIRDKTKIDIIESVDMMFLDAHPVDKLGANLVVPSWLRSGEWLLRIGVIQMRHAMGRAEAERTFNRVADDCSALAPYAFYYLACMSMKNFLDMREQQTSVHLKSRAAFKEDVDQAITQFAKARVAFNDYLERRCAEVSAIQQRAGSTSAASGIQQQLRERQGAIGQIMANIDWLIGEPLSATSFRQLTSSKKQQHQLFESLKMIDVIAPPLVGKDCNTAFYHKVLRSKFGIGQKELARIGATSSDSGTRRTVMSGGGAALTSHLGLPTRMDFWNAMKAVGAFYDFEHVYYVNHDALEAVASSIALQPMVLDDRTARFGLLYSNRAMYDCALYSKSEIDALVATDQVLATNLRTLFENDSMELDLLARINTRQLQESKLLHFEHFTRVQLQEYFDIDEAMCCWIITQLITHGVIKEQRVSNVKLAVNWSERTENLQWTSTSDASIEITSWYGLQTLEFASDISPWLLRTELCELGEQSEEDGSRVAQELFNALLQQNVLQREELLAYRKTGPLNCSMMPSTLADPVLNFLSHHFSYTFVRGVLLEACAESEKAHISRERKYPTKKVMLSANTHQELFDELCRLEIISPSRITSRHFEIIDYSDFPYYDKQELEHFIYARRLKLRDDIQMFKLVPFVEFLQERRTVVTGEMEALMDLGMTAAVSLKKLSTAQKIGGALSQCFRFLVDNRQMLMKCITFAIGTVLAMKGLGEAMGGINTDEFGEKAFAFIAAAGAQYQQFEMNAPREVSQKLHEAASTALGAIEWVQGKIGQGIEFVGAMMMGGFAMTTGAFVSGIDWMDRTVVTRVTGLGIHQCMSYLFERCRALFGSSEYYHQCRMATHTIVSRAPANDTKGEYRIIRMFDNITESAAERSREVKAIEQKLIDQTIVVARKVKAEVMSRLIPSPSLCFSELSKYLSSLENYRWFEAELTLCIQWAKMGALRALTETGRINEFDWETVKYAAVVAAYSALLNDCEDENNQRNKAEREEEEENLESLITDVVELKITDLFTTPLVNFVRCIIAEHVECKVSEPHQKLLDADIAKAARELRRANPNVWLEMLQRNSHVSRVHGLISKLFHDIASHPKSDLCVELSTSIGQLIRLCIIHRLPMPFEPCFSVICRVYGHRGKQLELDAQTRWKNDPTKPFILLSEADYSQWKSMFNSRECVYLFETMREHNMPVC